MTRRRTGSGTWSPACCRSRLAAALVVVASLALGMPAARSGELSGDEQKWVRSLLDALDANSPAVRRGAETALAAMGADALPVVVEALPLKSDAARRGLLRALRGMGTPKVRERLERMRESARGAAAKRIDELLADFAAELSPDAPLTIPLHPSTDLLPAKAPLAAERVIADRIPAPFAASTLLAKPDGDVLLVDTDGDGTLETKVLAKEARPVLLGPAPRSTPVLLYRKGDRWFACSASMLRGMRGKTVFDILDVDLDGAFDGSLDQRRVGDGAFGEHGETRRLSLDEGPATYEVTGTTGGGKLTLRGVRRPDGVDDDTWDGFLALGVIRMRLGLAAPELDASKSRACRKHCEYLVQNAGSKELEGLGAHSEHVGRPGYSADGAQAGSASGLAPSPDAGDGVRALFPTMLHRGGLLGAATTEYGIASARGRGGWTAVWGSSARASSAPLVVPAPGQTGVPTNGHGEVPPPDDPSDWYARPRGYPVAAYLDDRTWARATLALFDGTTPIPARVWTPQRPVTSRDPENDRAVFLMSDAPLPRATTIRAELTGEVDGKPVRYTWLFTTM